jgi:hypothetical protein
MRGGMFGRRFRLWYRSFKRGDKGSSLFIHLTRESYDRTSPSGVSDRVAWRLM